MSSSPAQFLFEIILARAASQQFLTYAQAKRHGEAHMRRVDPLPLHASATPSWPVELTGLARHRP
jgi:hypothetical protein